MALFGLDPESWRKLNWIGCASSKHKILIHNLKILTRIFAVAAPVAKAAPAKKEESSSDDSSDSDDEEEKTPAPGTFIFIFLKRKYSGKLFLLRLY